MNITVRCIIAGDRKSPYKRCVQLKPCQAVGQTRNLGIIHLGLPKMWDNTWYFIEYGINEKLDVELQRKYKTVDR